MLRAFGAGPPPSAQTPPAARTTRSPPRSSPPWQPASGSSVRNATPGLRITGSLWQKRPGQRRFPSPPLGGEGGRIAERWEGEVRNGKRSGIPHLTPALSAPQWTMRAESESGGRRNLSAPTRPFRPNSALRLVRRAQPQAPERSRAPRPGGIDVGDDAHAGQSALVEHISAQQWQLPSRSVAPVAALADRVKCRRFARPP